MHVLVEVCAGSNGGSATDVDEAVEPRVAVNHGTRLDDDIACDARRAVDLRGGGRVFRSGHSLSFPFSDCTVDHRWRSAAAFCSASASCRRWRAWRNSSSHVASSVTASGPSRRFRGFPGRLPVRFRLASRIRARQRLQRTRLATGGLAAHPSPTHAFWKGRRAGPAHRTRRVRAFRGSRFRAPAWSCFFVGMSVARWIIGRQTLSGAYGRCALALMRHALLVSGEWFAVEGLDVRGSGGGRRKSWGTARCSFITNRWRRRWCRLMSRRCRRAFRRLPSTGCWRRCRHRWPRCSRICSPERARGRSLPRWPPDCSSAP